MKKLSNKTVPPITDIIRQMVKSYWRKWDTYEKYLPDSENNVMYEDIILQSVICSICVGYISRYHDEYSLELKYRLLDTIEHCIDEAIEK